MNSYRLTLRPFTPYYVIGWVVNPLRDKMGIHVTNPYSKREFKVLTFKATPEQAESIAKSFGPYLHQMRELVK